MNFVVKFPVAKFRKLMLSARNAVHAGVLNGLAQAMEQNVGTIKATTLGPHVWNKQDYTGRRGPFVSMAFAMAMNIAKREGHTDFKRGRSRIKRKIERIRTGFTPVVEYYIDKNGKERLRTKKVWNYDYVTRERRVSAGEGGAGWKRVLELVPRMATFRPTPPQMLWIQSGQTRKSLDWGIIAKGDKHKGHGNPRVLLQDALAVGFVTIRTEQGEKHEQGKYPFARPVVEQSIKDGSVTTAVNRGIQQTLDKVKAQP